MASITYNIGETYIKTITPLNYFWDLSTDSYSSVSSQLIKWESDYAYAQNDKYQGTNVNTFIPPTRTQTRMYSGNKFGVYENTGYRLTEIIFTTASSTYADSLYTQLISWFQYHDYIITKDGNNISASNLTSDPYDFEFIPNATIGLTGIRIFYERDK